MLLIKGLVDELDIKNDNYQINKLKISPLLKKYPHAYQELLAVGFVREVNESSNYQFNTYIVFGNDEFMEHSVAKTFLYNNGNLLDSDLIKNINGLLPQNARKVNVLKWCMIHAIKTGQLKNIESITEAYLSMNEKSEIITFLGEVLESEHSSTIRNDALNLYFKHSFSEKLFDYFFGLELINSDYKKFLQVLLKFELSNKKKILIHTTLSIIATIQLDLNELEISLAKLKAFPKTDFETFAVNPLNCLDAIYYHLKYGIIKTEAITDLTKLYFNTNGEMPNLKKSASNDMLFLLGLHTLLLSNNPRKLLRFIRFLDGNYRPKMSDDYTSQYDFFEKIIEANSYFELGELSKVMDIYNSMSSAYKKNSTLLTPYMKILFYSLKIKTMVNTPKENQIAPEMKQINNIVAQFGYKFSKMYALSILLKSPTLQNISPEFYKQINYDFNKITREYNLNPKVFLQTINIKI
jgi:flagellin-specific chaperone FliS